MNSKEEILLVQEMENIWNKTLKCRSLFPYTDISLVGQQKARTAPYYRQFGFNVKFDFGVPLSLPDIEEINSVGHYINQNFIVRLYALLEYFRIIGNKIRIDKSISTWEGVDILRLLRGKFVHSSGKYNPDDPNQKKLYKRIITHFNLGNNNPPDFPIPIDAVLEKIFLACKEYAQEFLKKKGGLMKYDHDHHAELVTNLATARAKADKFIAKELKAGAELAATNFDDMKKAFDNEERAKRVLWDYLSQFIGSDGRLHLD